MEWTASVPVAATSHSSAPKPPNDPKHSNDDNRDVPMRETNEETKEKESRGTQKNNQQDRDKENRVHWGENVVHEVGDDTNKNKHNKGLQETQ